MRLREMVLAGMGISVMMLRSAQSDLAAGTMVELDVEIDPMYLQLRYAKNLRGNPPRSLKCAFSLAS